jgi:hypothetical protein
MAVGQFFGFVVIILMVFFSRPELISLRNFGFDIVAFFLKRLAKLRTIYEIEATRGKRDIILRVAEDGEVLSRSLSE